MVLPMSLQRSSTGCKLKRPRPKMKVFLGFAFYSLTSSADGVAAFTPTTWRLETVRLAKKSSSSRNMVLTTPESIIEQASTKKLLDDLIDESVRTSARRPIMMQFDPSSGWIWKRWKGTVFSETWDSCVSKMVYAMAIVFIFKSYPGLKERLTGFNTLWGQLLSVTTFTLTFFVNQSYALWRKCYELSRRLQGRLHDMGLTLAAHAARKPPASPNEPSTYTAASRQQLEIVSRYIRLFNILTYASFTRSHRPILTPRGMRRLVERGLMTPKERELLVDAELPATQRHNAVLMWITRAYVEGREAGLFLGGGGFENQFMDKIHVTRAQYGAIGDELAGRMPLAYAHIVQVLVDVVLWMYPLMAISSGMSPLLAVLGTGLLTVSYQGLFDLAKQFLDPYDNESYGKGEDPLVVDTLIAETNAGSVRWMHSLEQFPLSPQRIRDGELSAYLLPVRGYTVTELAEMEAERLQRERELQERREKEEEERRIAGEREARLKQAAEAMIPAMISPENLRIDVLPVSRAFHVNGALVNGATLPSAVKTSFGFGRDIAKAVYSVDSLAGGIPSSMAPDGIPVAKEEKKITNPVYSEPEAPSSSSDSDFDEDILNKARSSDRLDDGEYDDDDEETEDWDPEENYVHVFDSFEPYKDLPWMDDVDVDGKEVRLSQMLADELWDEEIEHAQEQVEKIETFDEFTKRAEAIRAAASDEIAETKAILGATPGSDSAPAILTKGPKDPSKYDQTKLDGVSQLWGLAPGELSDLQSYEEPSLSSDLTEFDGIDLLLGGTQSSTRGVVGDESVYDTESFTGVNSLWGGFDDETGDTELSSSATRVIRGSIGSKVNDGIGRLSQMLADEVWEEVEPEEEPNDFTFAYEDYTRRVEEILEAENQELLETEAIMNAPSFAENLDMVDPNDEKALKAANSTSDDDELAVLEMDNEDDNNVRNSMTRDSVALMDQMLDLDGHAGENPTVSQTDPDEAGSEATSGGSTDDTSDLGDVRE